MPLAHPATPAGDYEPCSPSDPGAQELGLQWFADNHLADKVLPPSITMRDFEKVGGGEREGRNGARSERSGSRGYRRG